MYHGEKTRRRKKRKYEKGGIFLGTHIGETQTRSVRSKGGGSKSRLLKVTQANVSVSGKNIVCEVLKVDENPANKDFTRRSLITKGAIITAKTPEGKEIKVKVTSRPGQTGILNAVELK